MGYLGGISRVKGINPIEIDTGPALEGPLYASR